ASNSTRAENDHANIATPATTRTSLKAMALHRVPRATRKDGTSIGRTGLRVLSRGVNHVSPPPGGARRASDCRGTARRRRILAAPRQAVEVGLLPLRPPDIPPAGIAGAGGGDDVRRHDRLAVDLEHGERDRAGIDIGRSDGAAGAFVADGGRIDARRAG